jgi:hypothetical protein
LKTCRQCGVARPLEDFYPDRRNGSRRAHCKDCGRQQVYAWRDANRARYDAVKRQHDLRKHYGISQAEYEALLAAQGGVCAICGDTDPGRGGRGLGGQRRYFAVDHNHTTGSVRGLLCDRCNRVLGRVDDTPDLLRRMAAYLESHGFR